MTRRSLLLGIVLMIAASAGPSCGHNATEEVETDTVVPVTTAPAELGSIRAVIHATGDVNPAPGAELIVVAPEPARIAEVTKGEGERVRRGEVLVRFEIPTLNAEATSRGAETTAADARLRVARENLARMQDLFTRGVAARKEVEDAEKEVADAQAALTQAQAARGSAQTLAGRQTVHATFDGVIGKRFHNAGDQVEASATDPVLRVIDPTRLQVDASVAIPDLSRIVVGATGRLLMSADAPPLPLKVVARPSVVEPGTAAAPVRLRFLTPHNLAVGTPVQVEIDAEEHTKVVLVPAAAIVREGEETAVFIAAGGKAQRRPVQLGIVDDEHAEIKEGVKPGEQVIVHGQAGLPDGAAITPEKTAPDKPAEEKPEPK
jgi:RND family efflux transporter MFP subunit